MVNFTINKDCFASDLSKLGNMTCTTDDVQVSSEKIF